jgi:hypothetical protein
VETLDSVSAGELLLVLVQELAEMTAFLLDLG